MGLAPVLARATAAPAAAAQTIPVPFLAEGDYPPGVTALGAGLARVGAPGGRRARSTRRAIEAARGLAVSRALGDARERAEIVAKAIGAALGEVDEVEVGEGFPAIARCLVGGGRERCRAPAFAAAGASATFAFAGEPVPADAARAVAGSASASVAVRPDNRRSRGRVVRRRRCYVPPTIGIRFEARFAAG